MESQVTHTLAAGMGPLEAGWKLKWVSEASKLSFATVVEILTRGTRNSW